MNSAMKIVRPTLVLNKTICLQNIELMAEKAKRHKLRFRPHFKTHQSIEIGSWFRQFAVQHITVSSVQMANYFATDGWNDITIAFPFNVLELDELNKLSAKVTINIVLDNLIAIEKLNNKLANPTNAYIKISTGFNRAGILYSAVTKIEQAITAIEKTPNLSFKGFLTHSGHAYDAKSRNEVQNIQFDTILKMNELKKKFILRHPELEISVGDTPTCSVSENFHGIDEIRPGNFVFYDLTQHNIGACNIDDIAVRMYCPVVSKQRNRNEIIIYGGAIHFSKDFIQHINGKALYGRIVIARNNERFLLPSSDYLSRLSQEHGVIKVSTQTFNQIEIGDIIEIVPVHSCLTAQAMGRFITTKGEEISMMRPF